MISNPVDTAIKSNRYEAFKFLMENNNRGTDYTPDELFYFTEIAISNNTLAEFLNALPNNTFSFNYTPENENPLSTKCSIEQLLFLESINLFDFKSPPLKEKNNCAHENAKNLTSLEMLKSKGFTNFDNPNKDGITPIMYSDERTFEFFKENGCDLNAIDKEGRSVAMHLLGNKLIRGNLNSSGKDDKKNYSATISFLKKLIKLNINLKQRDNEGRSLAVYIAIELAEDHKEGTLKEAFSLLNEAGGLELPNKTNGLKNNDLSNIYTILQDMFVEAHYLEMNSDKGDMLNYLYAIPAMEIIEPFYNDSKKPDVKKGYPLQY